MKKTICSLLAFLIIMLFGGINVIASPAISTSITSFVINDSNDASDVLDAIEGLNLTFIDYGYSEEYDKIILKVIDEESNAEFELLFDSMQPKITLTSNAELFYITTKYVYYDDGEFSYSILIFMTSDGKVGHIPSPYKIVI